VSRRQRRKPPLTQTPLPAAGDARPSGHRLLLAALALLYVVFAVGHLAVTPVLSSGSFINAPDEPAHLAYVRLVAEERRLPTRADSKTTYEWHQPPFYYVLAAPLWPTGPHAVRSLGVACGLVGILLVWAATRWLAPADPDAATLAAGLVALLPMRHAITAAAGNDGLTEALFTLTLAIVIRVVVAGPSSARSAALGAALGAALLAKATSLLLVPIAFAAILLARRRGVPWRTVAGHLATCGACVVLIAGWWYARNAALYGAPLPSAAFAEEFAGTQQAADWLDKPLRVDAVTGDLAPSTEPMGRTGYSLLIANWTWRTLIGAYTPPAGAVMGVPRFLPPGFYLPHLLLGVCALVGLARLARSSQAGAHAVDRGAASLMVAAALLVLAAFGAFTWRYFQAQGRYLYPAILPLSSFTAMGLRAIVPEARRNVFSASVLGVMVLLSVVFLFGAVVPAYLSSP